MDELNNLLAELRRAEDNFNNATDDYIDAATYELKAVNEKINQYFKERRKAAVNEKINQYFKERRKANERSS